MAISIITKEQCLFTNEHKTQILEKINLKDNSKLGIGHDSFGQLWTSYFIGIDWLIENESYIAIEPKIENLDYVKMFIQCLNHHEISKFLKDIYNIDFQKKQIETPNVNWDLTPFLIVHFLSLLETIVQQGFKRNYVIKEENLNSKIKGKIQFSQQIKKNIFTNRKDRIYCQFQDYSIDCFENRLLKKTLLFVQSYSIKHLDKKKYKKLFQKQNQLISKFENISDQISFSEIKRIKINSIYKEYVEAVELAKKILHRFGYSFKNTSINVNKKLPPFWIDMSKLFELYTYSLLKDEFGTKIIYQLSEDGKRQTNGNYGDIDFIKVDEKILIDTKYKDIYCKENKYEIENIRQLSGYARDWGVLKKLNIKSDNEVIDCVIIYPNKNSTKDFKNVDLKAIKINQFTKFYKCGIQLPLK